ncbi:DUF397 domain-containing protein [Streptomyces sp. CWNU-52B]|uniref:DUF397 domain-containing protein n=1 Tax=unclassified Streptomyces TaxID=2593676 RepID=UPI0039C0280D
MTGPELNWQKSSFSGGPEGNCLHIAATPDGTLHLRESDTPDVTLTTAPQSLAGLLQHARTTTGHPLTWQKSTFSGGPEGECLSIAAAPDGTLRLRESDRPDVVLTTAPHSLAGLLQHARGYGRPHGQRTEVLFQRA